MNRLADRYTEEQKEFVKNNYKKFTTKQIAKRIKKSIESVKSFKYRNGYRSIKMSTKSRFMTLRRRNVYELNRIKKEEENERLLNGIESLDKFENMLMEMKALINLCEITDNKSIRSKAKIKLMQLSEIPINNPYL